MDRGLDGDAEALARVLEALPEMVVVLDREGTIRYINHVEENYDRKEVLGTPIDAYLAPDSKEVFRAAVESVLATGKEEEHEYQVPAPDGGIQWYRGRIVPFRDAGEFGMVMMVTNISELKTVQEAADQLRRLLPICSWCDKIQSEKGEWVTIEAHLETESGTKVSHGLCPDCYRDQAGGDDGEEGPNGNVASSP